MKNLYFDTTRKASIFEQFYILFKSGIDSDNKSKQRTKNGEIRNKDKTNTYLNRTNIMKL